MRLQALRQLHEFLAREHLPFDQSLADDLGQQEYSHMERMGPADDTIGIGRDLHVLQSGGAKESGQTTPGKEEVPTPDGAHALD
jgi:hypothetical protein